jgi:hypothetical protein
VVDSQEQQQRPTFTLTPPEPQPPHPPYTHSATILCDLEVAADPHTKPEMLACILFKGLRDNKQVHQLCKSILNMFRLQEPILLRLDTYDWDTLASDPVMAAPLPADLNTTMCMLKDMPDNLVVLRGPHMPHLLDSFGNSEVTVPNTELYTLGGTRLKFGSALRVPVRGMARAAALKEHALQQLHALHAQRQGQTERAHDAFAEAVMHCIALEEAAAVPPPKQHTSMYMPYMEVDDNPSWSSPLGRSDFDEQRMRYPIGPPLCTVESGVAEDRNIPLDTAAQHAPAASIQHWPMQDTLAAKARQRGVMSVPMFLGVNIATLIISMLFTFTSLHVEDLLLSSVNHMLCGAAKVWWWLPLADLDTNLQAIHAHFDVKNTQSRGMRARAGTIHAADPLYKKMINAMSALQPAELRSLGFKRFVQLPGDIVVTRPGFAFHATRSTGYNLALSGNFLSVHDGAAFEEWHKTMLATRQVHGALFKEYSKYYI